LKALKQVPLGSSGLEIGAVGFGAWGLSGDYGPADDRQSILTLHRSLDLGANLIDTADEYGNGGNERLVGRAVAGRRAEAVVATKAGIVHGRDGAVGVCGRPDHLRASLDRSLARLGIDTIDLFYLHRVDAEVPIEETVGAMADLVGAGKARFIGLSEAGPETIRRASAVHPLTAIQSEYSLWTRGPEQDVLPIVRELGIGFVAFSPLGRGFLAGGVATPRDLGPGDFRRRSPRFSDESLPVNRKLLAPLQRVAAARGATAAQVALAWLVDRGVVPIPGTRRAERVDENVQAAELSLTPDERDELERAFRPGAAAGARYPEALEVLTGR
jgi:aryl-alcohol dehydrogenase-like predicted oxidoreductase